MFGSTSLTLLIWDPDNSLTDCLCGVISTHLMWVGITADGLWSTERFRSPDGFWSLDGFWSTDVFRPTDRFWPIDGLWTVDECWPVSEGQLTDGLIGLPKVGKPYWLVRNTIICHL